MVPVVSVGQGVLQTQEIRGSVCDPGAGAVVLFEGCARDHHGGRRVEELAYEAFVPMAELELRDLREEAMSRFGLQRCVIHHRIGTVPVGEAAVVVATASAHRGAAFESAQWIMDRIKERVPIWKRERYANGESSWVEGQERLL